MLRLTATQECVYAITIEDVKGNPAQVDGVPAWATSNPEVLTVTASEDGMSAVVKAGKVGLSQVSVTCDADLGEGVTPLVGMDDVEVVAGQAAVIKLAAGTPTEQA